MLSNLIIAFKQYQEAAQKTAQYPKQVVWAYLGLGLTGEAGEVANKIKKAYRDNGGYLTPEAKEAILDELGDCLWYISQITTELGEDLARVANRNIHKLQSRQSRGKIGGSGDNR